MTIFRWFPDRDPFAEWTQLSRRLDHLARSLGSQGVGAWSGVYPPLNFSEDDDNLYLRAELPGVGAGDIEISVEGDSLILRGERKIPGADEKVNYHRRERTAGLFRRVLHLPVQVAADEVKALTKNGVLTVTLPKAPEAKPRQIKVTAA